MARFLTDLDTTLITDSVWRVKSPLVYECDLLGGALLTVPADFYTDFASVPRLPIVYAMWGNKAHREATLHDALFRLDFPVPVSFMQANRIFLEAMKATGKPWYIRHPMYAAVSVGSYQCFHKRCMADVLS